MKFEYLLATKYLLKGRRHGFVSLIAVISVLGIAVGVMALIVVLAVMSGFDRELKTKIVGVQPHLIIEGVGGIGRPQDVRDTIDSLGLNQITSIAPFVQGQGIVRSQTEASGVVIKGIDPEREPMDLFRQHLKSGTLEFGDLDVPTEKRARRIGRAVIGEELARRLLVSI